MKSPMNMAPNKMVSPAKAQLGDLDKDGKMSSYETKRQSAIEKNMAKMKSPMQMSPAKMGSAYKMDKSAFKLKSAPVNMNTPGSVAKLAGVSPMKNPGQAKKSIDPKSLGTEVTDKPKYKGAKDAGKRVYKSSTGQITTTQKV